MPKLMALEWDGRQARVVVGRPRGAEIVLDAAFSVELPARDPGQTFADLGVGEQLAEVLAARGLKKTEVMVAVGRASIELRQLALPPAPEDELPELVRFQAMRQFTTIGEDWPIDFVPIGESQPDEPADVIAAAISPEMVEQIRDNCAEAELTAKSLVLRPYAAASLLCRHDRGTGQPARLMVDLLADEADLTVLVDEEVALMRTDWLSTSDVEGAQAKMLLGEIRRTIAAAQSQLKGKRVEKVIVCGDGTDQAALKEQLESALSLEIVLFDPFGEVQLARGVDRPEHAGRFAPLIGILMDEATGAKHALDFLDPRRKPEPPSRRQRNLLMATAATALLCCTAVGIWLLLDDLDSEALSLISKSNGLKKSVERSDQITKDVQTVNSFLESDTNWLEEMSQLSEALPSAERVIVTQVNLSTRNPKGSQIILDGYVADSADIETVRNSLRSGGRQVVSTGGQNDLKRKDYQWRFKETVLIEPRPVDAAPLDDEPPPKSEATESSPSDDDVTTDKDAPLDASHSPESESAQAAQLSASTGESR